MRRDTQCDPRRRRALSTALINTICILNKVNKLKKKNSLTPRVFSPSKLNLLASSTGLLWSDFTLKSSWCSCWYPAHTSHSGSQSRASCTMLSLTELHCWVETWSCFNAPAASRQQICQHASSRNRAFQQQQRWRKVHTWKSGPGRTATYSAGSRSLPRWLNPCSHLSNVTVGDSSPRHWPWRLKPGIPFPFIWKKAFQKT